MTTIDFSLWFYNLLTIVYAVTIISCVAVVLSEKRNPIKSLAWTIALIFLPVAGLVFYLFFGRSMKNLHMISRHNKRKLLSRQPQLQVPIDDLPLSDNDRQLLKLADSLGATSLSCAYSLDIYSWGEDKFRRLKEDLESARNSINLQYYIFSDDALGQEIAEILMRKASEGVKVRVIYDHVGSFSVRRRFFTKMKKAGVEAHPFFRVTFPQLANRVNWRNHRKIVVIDDAIGYIGGMNIATRYASGMRPGEVWRDTHVRVEGPIVASMLYSFAVDWNFLKHHTDIHPIKGYDNPLTAGQRPIPMQLITSGPNDKWTDLALIFQKAILSARKSVYIQTPYFLPTDALLKALQTASLAKVDVRIMIPRVGDSFLLRYASYSYIGECLAAGIKIYFYEPGMLHAKNMMVDDEFCTTGSTNFDFRSFEHNFEGNLLIYDRETNEKMRRIFFEDIHSCTKITSGLWQKRSRRQRFLESIMRLTSPVL